MPAISLRPGWWRGRAARLHQRAGFRVVGRRERIAQRADGWADTIIMERRSTVVGG